MNPSKPSPSRPGAARLARALAAAAAVSIVIVLSFPGTRAGLERLLSGADRAPDASASQVAQSSALADHDQPLSSSALPIAEKTAARDFGDPAESAQEAGPEAADPVRSGGADETSGASVDDLDDNRSATEPPKPQHRTIRGSVFDAAGVPLPGIEVSAIPAAGAAHDPGSGASRRAVSDELGMFEFTELAGDEYRLTVTESDSFHAASIRARAGAETADLHVQRKGEIRVAGTVHHQDEPLAGVRIRALGDSFDTRTDEHGVYETVIDRKKVSGQFVLEFALRGFDTVRKRVPAAAHSADGPVRLDVAMRPLNELVTFLGSVHGPDGTAVDGATVSLNSPENGFHREATTGPFGQFEIQAVESGVRYRLIVDPPDRRYRRHSSDPFVIDAASNAVDVVLKTGGEAALAGTVVNPSGEPLPFFRLWLRNTNGGPADPIPIETDARGHFDAVSVAAGAVKFESRSIPRLEASGIDLSAGEHLHLRVPIDWGEQWLSGRVIDKNGAPVPQAGISLHWTQDFGPGRSLSSRHTRSDAGGYFNFANLGARDYRVTCSAPGFRTTRLEARLEPDQELIIELERISAGGP